MPGGYPIWYKPGSQFFGNDYNWVKVSHCHSHAHFHKTLSLVSISGPAATILNTWLQGYYPTRSSTGLSLIIKLKRCKKCRKDTVVWCGLLLWTDFSEFVEWRMTNVTRSSSRSVMLAHKLSKSLPQKNWNANFWYFSDLYFPAMPHRWFIALSWGIQCTRNTSQKILLTVCHHLSPSIENNFRKIELHDRVFFFL